MADFGGILIDYHLLFITMAFVLFVIEIFLLFVDTDKWKAIGAMLMAGLNLNLCWIGALSFMAINIPGFTSSGVLVDNPTPNMWMFFGLFVGLWAVNVGLMFYAPTVIIRLTKKEQKELVRPLNMKNF